MIITLKAPCGTKFRFHCDNIIDGIPVNPALPARFDDTPNEARPDRHRAWWGIPFITAYTPQDDRTKFREHWPSGTRYDLRCLDGGAWDRATCWGMFNTIGEAVAQAKKGPAWMEEVPK